MKPGDDVRKGNGFGWIGPDGTIYLKRCFECGRENYVAAVTTGKCIWCGFDANKETANGSK